MKKKILYISTNDGSDMRINKEVKTLSKFADVYFLGIGDYGEKNYAKTNCKVFYLIEEKRNSAKAILKHIQKYKEWVREYKFDSIHIINEQLMIFFYPFLFNQHVVLDIFDSLFMKKNQPGNKLKTLKKIVYAPVNFLFVTDENRRQMMPDFVQNRLGILENYPNRYYGDTNKMTKDLTIFYNGSMSDARGTKILQNLIKNYSNVSVIMAGWMADENTNIFANSKSVDYRGVITQKEATKIAATEVDYIMCCYEPSNQNNINASPNKIYDAIQTHTPVIMNGEVKVASFVKEKNIGVVLDSFYDYDVVKVYKELIEKKQTFNFNDANATTYSWESIEKKLLVAHKLI